MPKTSVKNNVKPLSDDEEVDDFAVHLSFIKIFSFYLNSISNRAQCS